MNTFEQFLGRAHQSVDSLWLFQEIVERQMKFFYASRQVSPYTDFGTCGRPPRTRSAQPKEPTRHPLRDRGLIVTQRLTLSVQLDTTNQPRTVAPCAFPSGFTVSNNRLRMIRSRDAFPTSTPLLLAVHSMSHCFAHRPRSASSMSLLET